MAKAKRGAAENKSDLVRQYVAKHPSASVSAIQQGLHAQGVEISLSLASKIKYGRGKKATGKRRGAGSRKPSAGAGSLVKADLIRAEIQAMGARFRPRDVVASLDKKGVVVTSSHVISVAKSLGMKRRRRGRPARAAAIRAGGVHAERVSLNDLIAAKRLAEKLGGIEAAASALAALARLS